VATVATVIAQVKWQADRQRGGRAQTADLVPVANRAYKEAWDIIVQSHEDYRTVTSDDQVLAGGDGGNEIELEEDFYKLVAVQQKCGTDWGPPLPYYAGAREELSYRLEGGSIFVEPPSCAAGTYRYRYVTLVADLTDAGDEIEDVNGWVEAFMVDTMTVRVTEREEEDAGLLVRLRDELKQRVLTMAAHRSGPKRAADVRRRRRGRGRWVWMP
jgi:hypothetical protein